MLAKSPADRNCAAAVAKKRARRNINIFRSGVPSPRPPPRPPARSAIKMRSENDGGGEEAESGGPLAALDKQDRKEERTD